MQKGESPIKGSSKEFDLWFGVWWLSLNGAGVACFLVVLACQGTGKNAYFNALIALTLVVWEHAFIIRKKFPPLLRKWRTHRDPAIRAVSRQVEREYLGFVVILLSYFPYWAGHVYLFGFALYPAACMSDYAAYIPHFAAYK